MSMQEDGTYDEPAARRSQRRKQAVVGVAGAAAVLGGAAFFITEAVTRDDDVAEPPIAVAPVASARSASPGPATKPPATTPDPREPAASVSRKPSPTPTPSVTSPSAKSAEQRVRDARKKAAEDGVPVQRGLPGTTAPPELKVVESGDIKDGGTMRVVSAKGDLTGYRELGWVADQGEPVGEASCTQMFRFSGDTKPQRKPNLLVCWRTSDAKSVYTVTVSTDGKPSKQDSVGALAKQWSKLG